MSKLKIKEISNNALRQSWLKSQQDDGRPTEDDIVREHFGLKGEKTDDPSAPPSDSNTTWVRPIGW